MYAAFLQLDGIKGDSKDARYPDTIRVQSFGWGDKGSPSPAFGGGAHVDSSAAGPSDLYLQKQKDISSPFLSAACTNGKWFKEARLFSVTDDDKTLEIFMQNAMIASVSDLGSDEGVHFSFTAMKVNFKRPD